MNDYRYGRRRPPCLELVVVVVKQERGLSLGSTNQDRSYWGLDCGASGDLGYLLNRDPFPSLFAREVRQCMHDAGWLARWSEASIRTSLCQDALIAWSVPCWNRPTRGPGATPLLGAASCFASRTAWSIPNRSLLLARAACLRACLPKRKRRVVACSIVPLNLRDK